MTLIAHLSDLHFGRVRADLTRPLIAKLNEIAPDLVVVSGDFTQRARHSQYRASRIFLDALDSPWLAVPGNHDTPLYNLWVRFTRPWSRYRQHIHAQLETEWQDDTTKVVGINTAYNWFWQRGFFRGRARRRVAAELGPVKETHFGVVVMHHPLEQGPEVDKQLMKGADKALVALSEVGADVVLSGHLHTTLAQPFEAAPGLLFVQAGTGLSSRVRGEKNSFNLLHIGADNSLRIERYAAGDAPVFERDMTRDFRYANVVWVQST